MTFWMTTRAKNITRNVNTWRNFTTTIYCYRINQYIRRRHLFGPKYKMSTPRSTSYQSNQSTCMHVVLFLLVHKDIPTNWRFRVFLIFLDRGTSRYGTLLRWNCSRRLAAFKSFLTTSTFLSSTGMMKGHNQWEKVVKIAVKQIEPWLSYVQSAKLSWFEVTNVCESETPCNKITSTYKIIGNLQPVRK